MRNEKQTAGTVHVAVNHRQIADESNSELITLIDDYFNVSGVGEPVEIINFLLTEVTAESKGYRPTFLRDAVFEASRLVTFLTKLYEDRKFMKFHEQKMN